MKRINYFIYCILIAFACTSCAIQVAPSGGEQDVIAAKVLESKPENFSTGFNSQEIAIRFDEYIQLKDVQSQLVVSPPLNTFPDVKIRKKTLLIQFEDTLEENTTYTFNFGNSIVDNNEGNVVENYQFVFSTGEIIDSLFISGMVRGAFDLNPQKDVLVMLYKSNDDSLPFLKRPYYFSKTNEEGKFQVKNISPGKYKIIALADINKDYLFNPPEEGIAFSDSMVFSGEVDVSLLLFKEEEPFKLVRTYSEEPGKAVCVFNGAADTLKFYWITDTISLELLSTRFSEKRDSMSIYYKNLEADTIQLMFPQLNEKDTVTIRLLKRDSRASSRGRQGLTVVPQISSGTFQDLNRPLDLVFNHPIEVADISRINFLEDSVVLPAENFRFVDSLHTRLRYLGEWKQGANYNLLIPSGSFKDFSSQSNDTLISKFRTKQETDYASITAIINSAGNRYPYIVQLINDRDKVAEELVINTDSTIDFSFLIPGMYKLKIVEDKNKNGLWDTGNYLSGKQAEKIFYYADPIQMRANWDVEIKWTIPE